MERWSRAALGALAAFVFDLLRLTAFAGFASDLACFGLALFVPPLALAATDAVPCLDAGLALRSREALGLSSAGTNFAISSLR